jgi:superfamily II DNA or RNA helicase
MPTGGGKTFVGAEIARAALARGRGVLWLTHRVELVAQAIGANGAGVDVRTVQGLLTSGDRPPAHFVVVDECHNFIADQFASVIRDYPDAFVLGLTATPERGDGRGLGEMFERVVIGATTRELVDAGLLVHAEILRPHVKLRAGQIAASPVTAYAKLARGRRAISFTSSVSAATDHAVQFHAAGFRTEVISGETPKAKRVDIVARYRAGEMDVLNNCFVLTEGFDAPETSCIIIARGCGTLGTYLQIVGRGLRIAPNKTDCLVLDLNGVSHVHGHPEDSLYVSLDGRGMRRTKADVNRYCAVCGAIFATPPCRDCGSVAEPVGSPRVTGSALEKFERRQKETPEERAQCLRGLYRTRTPAQARAIYRSMFKHWPTADVERMARR